MFFFFNIDVNCKIYFVYYCELINYYNVDRGRFFQIIKKFGIYKKFNLLVLSLQIYIKLKNVK